MAVCRCLYVLFPVEIVTTAKTWGSSAQLVRANGAEVTRFNLQMSLSLVSVSRPRN